MLYVIIFGVGTLFGVGIMCLLQISRSRAPFDDSQAGVSKK